MYSRVPVVERRRVAYGKCLCETVRFSDFMYVLSAGKDFRRKANRRDVPLPTLAEFGKPRSLAVAAGPRVLSGRKDLLQRIPSTGQPWLSEWLALLSASHLRFGSFWDLDGSQSRFCWAFLRTCVRDARTPVFTFNALLPELRFGCGDIEIQIRVHSKNRTVIIILKSILAAPVWQPGNHHNAPRSTASKRVSSR